MAIKYRPHRELLMDAMREEKTFETIDEMLDYIVDDLNSTFKPISSDVPPIVSKEDLSISEDLGKDIRIDWTETRHICTKRLGTDVYETPACIAMCSFE